MSYILQVKSGIPFKVLCVAFLLVAVNLTIAGIAAAGLSGTILISGYGPELPIIQELGRAFEKRYPGTVVDIQWHRNVKAVDLVKSGQAQVAVTGAEHPGLQATPIAWDGIAVIVNFANPVKEVTAHQVAKLFTGRLTWWSDVDGSGTRVELIRRPQTQNIVTGFERTLGIVGKLSPSAKLAASDQQALSQVSGKVSAVTYISLGAALKAQEHGIPIRILMVDRVEPAEPTVEDGRYKLRRPVLLLTKRGPDPVTTAFAGFALSPEGQKIVRQMFVPYGSTLEKPKQVEFVSDWATG